MRNQHFIELLLSCFTGSKNWKGREQLLKFITEDMRTYPNYKKELREQLMNILDNYKKEEI